MLPVVLVGLNHINLPDMLVFTAYSLSLRVLFWTLSSKKNGYLTS